MKKILFVVAAASLLAGCKNLDQRLNECEAHGIDRNVCYEQDRENRRNTLSNYAVEDAGNAQAKAIRESKSKHHKH